jgi:hypothetical protein
MPYSRLIQELELPPDRFASDRVFFHYMGKAEYEHGALDDTKARCVAAMGAETWTPHLFPAPNGLEVWYVGPREEFASAYEWFITAYRSPTELRIAYREDPNWKTTAAVGWWPVVEEGRIRPSHEKPPHWALFMSEEYALRWVRWLRSSHAPCPYGG